MSCRSRSGFSLLEVILALAILTGAIAVLGELARQGVENARRVRDLSQAQLLCESMMSQITSGLVAPEAMQATALETDDPDHLWLCTVEVDTVDEEGLLSVRVTVSQDTSTDSRPVSCSLTRWVIDPESTSANSTESTGSSTQSSSGTSSSTN